MDTAKLVGKWLTLTLLALALIGAGGAKLAGVPDVHQSFGMMGLPPWFGYFIGGAEVAGGIGVLIPRLSAIAAACLVPILIGASYFHIAYSVPSAAPALILLVLTVFAIVVNRNNALWFPGQTKNNDS